MTKSPNQTPLRVSVVIPAYNESRVISGCLDALAHQTIAPFEVIVVDNNSHDDTVALASSYPLVRIIHEPRQGITYARSRGFDEARGDIIARIDADTIVSPEWIHTIIREFCADEKLTAICGHAAFAEISPKGRFWGRWYFANFRAWHQRSIGVAPMMYGHNCALRRNIWQQIRARVSMGDASISEDVDVTLAILEHGGLIKFVPDLIVKCHHLRAILDIRKLRRYYQTDNYTLRKYQTGNKHRWAHDDTRG